MMSRQRAWAAWLVLLLAATLSAPALSAPALSAQARGETRFGRLPASVQRLAVDAWNDSSHVRIIGRYVVAAGDTVGSTLVVRDGPLVIAGVVRGNVVAVNADTRLDSTARILGTLTVIGGVFVGQQQGFVQNDIAVWGSALSIRELDGGQIALEAEDTSTSRYAMWRERGVQDLRDILVTSEHTYNRVEGLALVVGPRLRLKRGDSRAEFTAFGIFRTGDRLALDRANLGHRLRAEFREGSDAEYIAFGAEHVDEVDAVEPWTLSRTETGLSSLFFARDYRDYWNRYGGHAFVSVGHNNDELRATARVGRELWGRREAQSPLALFPEGREWRANPGAVEGEATLLELSAVLDTRNNRERPRDGWYLQADYEAGKLNVTEPDDPTLLALTPNTMSYGRLFLDLRRYTRIAPHTSVNFRVVAGGLVHGNALPAQRALSVSGAAALPGYAFRALPSDSSPDTGMCNTRSEADYLRLGAPARCDRILLLQAEWKGEFRLALFGREQANDDRRWYTDGFRTDASWVVFVNSGRGWLIGPRDGGLSYPRARVPLFDGFRTDAGAGVDFGALGVYVAQPLQAPWAAPRIFVRLGARF